MVLVDAFLRIAELTGISSDSIVIFFFFFTIPLSLGVLMGTGFFLYLGGAFAEWLYTRIVGGKKPR